jgi:hypothetical protein
LRTAIATVATGPFRDYHRHYCREAWEAYCTRHGIDLFVFEETIDASRPPAWQKLLVFSDPRLAGYDAVCFLDADIAINLRTAPSIFDSFVEDRIAMCAHEAYFHTQPFALAQERKKAIYELLYRQNGLPPFEELAGFGFGWDEKTYNTGVVMASPARFAGFFRDVFHGYQDLGRPEYNYEQWFLNHEALKNGLVHEIDPKFNVIWDILVYTAYPFLRLERPFINGYHNCVRAALGNSYFLHFANRRDDIRFCTVPHDREELLRLIEAEIRGIREAAP